MFNKILWATDGSEASDQALPIVRQLATHNDAAIVVFHIEERLVGARTYGYPVYVDADEVIDKIRAQTQELVEAGFDAIDEVMPAQSPGGVAHDIANGAERAGADLIVVATRGHTALGGLLLGSVTQRLLHLTGRPVLVVPVKETTQDVRSSTETGSLVSARDLRTATAVQRAASVDTPPERQRTSGGAS